MTTVSREVPSNFWLLLFYTYENTTVQNFFKTTGQTFPDTMPPSLCNGLEILMCSQNAQYVSRQHQENDVTFGHLDGICQTLPSNHHRTLLFIPACVNAEKILKQTIIQVLSTAQNAHVKLMTVSYPENFLRAEANKLNTFQSEAKICNPYWLRSRQMELAATSAIRGNIKCKIQWERPVLKRRNVSFSTTSWASEVRRAVQRDRNILHRTFAKMNRATLLVWTESYLGYWIGCN